VIWGTRRHLFLAGAMMIGDQASSGLIGTPAPLRCVNVGVPGVRYTDKSTPHAVRETRKAVSHSLSGETASQNILYLLVLVALLHAETSMHFSLPDASGGSEPDASARPIGLRFIQRDTSFV